MINILIGFMIGSIFAVLIQTYTTSRIEKEKIKKDVLVRELLEENKKYQKHYEAVSDMNKDYWG